MSAKKTFSLRLPEDLRIEAERLAKEESRTLTSLITHLLTREVAARRGAMKAEAHTGSTPPRKRAK